MEKIRPFRDAPAERDVIVEPVTALRHWECLDLLMEAYSLGKKMPVLYVADGLGCSCQQVYNIFRQVRS